MQAVRKHWENGQLGGLEDGEPQLGAAMLCQALDVLRSLGAWSWV